MTSALVLVAAGNAGDRARLAGEVRDLGHTAVEAPLGDTLVALARAECPRLVVLDMAGGAPDAAGALAALRADPALAAVPVLALAAGGTAPADADDHLPAPWTAEQLGTRVTAGLRRGNLAAAERERALETAAFARRAGHDLKSPLTVMVATAQTLARRWDAIEAGKRVQLLETLADGAHRAAALITDFVSVATAGADAYTRPDALADAAGVARAVVAATTEAGEARIEGDWVPVRVAPDALSEVLARLVDNAGRHGRDASGRLAVTLAARPLPGALEVTVDDDGPGIDPAVADRLFEPFERGPAAVAADPDATGVGLAVVRRIVEQWGGRVEAGASPSGGARIRLVLPAAP